MITISNDQKGNIDSYTGSTIINTISVNNREVNVTGSNKKEILNKIKTEINNQINKGKEFLKEMEAFDYSDYKEYDILGNEIKPNIKYLYIHGFNSSGNGTKVEMLKKEFGEDNVIAPTLSHNPYQAIKELRKIITKSDDKFIVIGTSLGGYYAMYLTYYSNVIKTILINPSINPQYSLQKYIGKNKNYNTGVEYELNNDHINHLPTFQIDPLTISKLKISVYLDMADEVLDSEETLDYFVKYGADKVICFSGGNHRFTHMNDLMKDLKTNT